MSEQVEPTIGLQTHLKTDPVAEEVNPKGPVRMILAASTGGHLSQLVRLSPMLGASENSLWITFDTPQSRSLLKGRRVLYVPYIAPRDFRSVARAFRQITSHLKASEEVYEEAVSTGAGLALAALPAARVQGIPARYIESVSRTEGPSLSGRILQTLRFTKLETQHKSWARGRWNYRGSVLGAFEARGGLDQNTKPKLFVTLGTIRPYRFDSAVDAVLRTGLADADTVWQLGCTARTGLPGTTYETVDDEHFQQLIRESDVIITHSGVGSILRILESGKYPVVVTRRKHRNEHVDDHQSQIAELLSENGVANSVEVDELDAGVVIDATTRKIVQRGGRNVH